MLTLCLPVAVRCPHCGQITFLFPGCGLDCMLCGGRVC